jgi:hypothetical protein
MAITFSRFTRTGALYDNDNANAFVDEDARVLLVSTAHTFDPTAEFVADIVADEVTNDTGTGYERKTLGTKSRAIETDVAITGITGNKDIIKLTAATLTYTAINTNERIGGGYVFIQKTDDSDSVLLGLFNLTNDIPSDVVELPTVTIAPDATLGYLYKPLL